MTLRDIFNIYKVKKQPVFKIQTDKSKNDPSDAKKAKKSSKKGKAKTSKKL